MSEKEEQILSKMIYSICWCHHVILLSPARILMCSPLQLEFSIRDLRTILLGICVILWVDSYLSGISPVHTVHQTLVSQGRCHLGTWHRVCSRWPGWINGFHWEVGFETDAWMWDQRSDVTSCVGHEITCWIVDQWSQLTTNDQHEVRYWNWHWLYHVRICCRHWE